MSNGATPNERLLAAARNDDEEGLLQAIEEDADINCRDGAGDTPLHLAVKHESLDALEHILSHDECDVDPENSLTGKTPLHYAIELEGDSRLSIVESLLDAGADTRVKDKNGTTALDLVRPDDTEVLVLVQKTKAQKTKAHNTIGASDIADDDDDDEGGDESGSD